jgi:hypothetical protein
VVLVIGHPSFSDGRAGAKTQKPARRIAMRIERTFCCSKNGD